MKSAEEVRIQKYFERFKSLEAKKEKWNSLYEEVDDYSGPFKKDFNTESDVSGNINDALFDNSASRGVQRAASQLIADLWPKGGKSAMLEPVRSISNDVEAKDFFDEFNPELSEDLDNPASGLVIAFDEYFQEQLKFGTSGVMTKEDDLELFSCESWTIENCFIDENERRIVDTVYRVINYPIRSLAKIYGEKNLSKKTLKAFQDGKFEEKVKVLHLIQPRSDRNDKIENNLNMPFESVHLEWDSKHILKESGFEEFPTPFGRLYKRSKKDCYGLSAFMLALADVRTLNSITESEEMGVEKSMSPPMGVYDGALGDEVLDTSPMGINVFRPSGRITNQNPIFQLQTMGDLRPLELMIQRKTNSIDDAFGIDRLLDSQNQTQMTLGEVRIRKDIRAASRRSIYARQIKEVLTPTISRIVNIKLKRGDHPALPDSIKELIANNKPFYKIKYLTPAARVVEAEEAQGILNTLEFIGGVAGIDPNIQHKFKLDKMAERVARIYGTSEEMIVSDDEYQNTLQQIAESRRSQEEVERAKTAASAVKEASQVQSA